MATNPVVLPCYSKNVVLYKQDIGGGSMYCPSPGHILAPFDTVCSGGCCHKITHIHPELGEIVEKIDKLNIGERVKLIKDVTHCKNSLAFLCNHDAKNAPVYQIEQLKDDSRILDMLISKLTG